MIRWTASVLLVVGVTSAAFAAKPVVIGKTYPIAEPDLMTELRARLAAKDWQKEFSIDPTKSKAVQSVDLPRAKERASFLHDPTYIIPRDIVGQDGTVIAREGQPINVYTRIKMPGRVIVIGNTEEDREWLKTVARPTQKDKVMLAGGSVVEVRSKHKIRVFLLDDLVIERFGLRAVPTIVQQEGIKLRIDEYPVDAPTQAPEVAS